MDFMPVMLKRLRITGSTMRPRSVADKAAIRDALAREIWPAFGAGRLQTHLFASFSLRAGRRGTPADGKQSPHR